MSLIAKSISLTTRIRQLDADLADPEKFTPQEQHVIKFSLQEEKSRLMRIDSTLIVLNNAQKHISRLIRELSATPEKSPHITLAIRHLEDAESRLNREL